MPALLTEVPEDPEARDSVTAYKQEQVAEEIFARTDEWGAEEREEGEQWIVNMGRQFRVTQTQWPGEGRVKNDVNEGIGECGPVGELWPDISWALSHLWREGNSDMLELWGRGAGHRWHLQCRRTPGPCTDTGTVTSLNILTFSPNINSWNIWTCDKRTCGQWGLWVRRHGYGGGLLCY